MNDLWKFDGTNWIWISGSNSTNQAGNYGTIGITSSLNVPGARYGAASWRVSNAFWLFGGYGYGNGTSPGSLNDLWKFEGGFWTWISGSNSPWQTGNSNYPSARYGSVSWLDSNNTLLLFGGRDTCKHLYLLL